MRAFRFAFPGPSLSLDAWLAVLFPLFSSLAARIPRGQRRPRFFLFFRSHASRINKLVFFETILTLGDHIFMSWDHVYRFVQRIPRGRVLTYGALARALSLPGGARTAGRAMSATPSGKGIPWHRVLGERGKILIREPYASLQRKLLESEGVALAENRVDLKRHLWKRGKASTLKQKPARKRISQ